MGRLSNIQVLRAVASLAVVSFHAGGTGSAYLGQQFSQLGPLVVQGLYGVDLFFTISGFIIFNTTRDCRVAPSEYLYRRLARVVPTYWLFSVLTVALIAIAPGVNSGVPSAGDVMRSLLFVSFLGQKTPIVFVGWTLEFEMFFYLSVFVWLLALRRAWRGVVMTLCGLALLGAALHPTYPVLAFITSPLLVEFCLGALVADCFLNRGHADRWSLASIVVAFAALAWTNPTNRVVLVGPAMAMLVFAASMLPQLKRSGVLPVALIELGDTSYAIYLVHVWIVSALAKVARQLVPGLPLDAFIICAALCAVIAGCAWYRGVERPIAFVLRRRVRGQLRPAD